MVIWSLQQQLNLEANQQVIERQTNDNLEYGKEYVGLIETPYRNLMLDQWVLRIKERPKRHRLFLPQDITQSLDVGITTTRIETFVAPSMDVVKRGVLIGSTTKMGNGLDGILAGRKLSGSTTLPTTNIGVVGTP